MVPARIMYVTSGLAENVAVCTLSKPPGVMTSFTAKLTSN